MDGRKAIWALNKHYYATRASLYVRPFHWARARVCACACACVRASASKCVRAIINWRRVFFVENLHFTSLHSTSLHLTPLHLTALGLHLASRLETQVQALA